MGDSWWIWIGSIWSHLSDSFVVMWTLLCSLLAIHKFQSLSLWLIREKLSMFFQPKSCQFGTSFLQQTVSVRSQLLCTFLLDPIDHLLKRRSLSLPRQAFKIYRVVKETVVCSSSLVLLGLIFTAWTALICGYEHFQWSLLVTTILGYPGC